MKKVFVLLSVLMCVFLTLGCTSKDNTTPAPVVVPEPAPIPVAQQVITPNPADSPTMPKPTQAQIDEINNTTLITTTPKKTANMTFVGHDVVIAGSAFNPSQLTIPAGDYVKWINNDAVDHQIVGEGFDSGILKPGDISKRSYKIAGTFEYSCALNPSMRGTIIVT